MVDIPPGWIRFPDGSMGPPNSVGSDWNAPYRGGPNGMGYPTSGILPPEAPGTPDQVSGRVGYPGIPARTSPAMSAPGTSYPAIDAALSGASTEPEPNYFGERPFSERGSAYRGPRWGGGPPPGFSMSDDAAPPPNRTIPGAHIDPTTGQPEMLTGPGGIAEKNQAGFNPLSVIRRGGFWPTLIESLLYPTPAETGELPQQTLGRSPSGPVRRPDTHLGVYDAPVAPASPAAPLPPPRPPGLGRNPAVPTAPAALPPAQSPWFTTFDRPNMDVAGGGRSNTTQGGVLSPGGGPAKMGMLDLSGMFGWGKPAAVAPVAAQPKTKIPATARADVPPQASGPMDPSIIARRKMKRSRASSSSQGGGY